MSKGAVKISDVVIRERKGGGKLLPADGPIEPIIEDHPESKAIAMAAAHEEHQRLARRPKLEMLADVISLMIDAKIVESRGFAKYDTVGKARLTLINVLAEVL